MDINSLKYHLRLCQDKNGLNIVQKRKRLRVTKERWGKVFLCLDILPAEIGRAARRTVESWRLATKGGETCEKFRQMKMPSVGVFFFFFCPTPTLLPHCWACQLRHRRGGQQVNEVVKEPPSPPLTAMQM